MKDNQAPECTFTVNSPAIANLLEQSRELADLETAWKVLLWDQLMMPSGARAERGPQLATLEAVKHERKGSSVLKAAVAQAAKELAAAPEQFTVVDHALIREVQRQIDIARVPFDLFKTLAQVRADNLAVWRKASQRNDFALVAPYFQRMIELLRRQAEYINPHVSPYEVLFALFEPDFPLDQCKEMLTRVCNACVDLLKELPRVPVSYKVVQGHFPQPQQAQIVRTFVDLLGYQPQFGRLDIADGFTDPPSPPQDVRFGVAIHPERIDRTLGTILHEMGHVLYAQGIHPILTRTILADATSYGLNEGQARFWETIIGTSEPFWRGQYHLLQTTFPQHFQEVPVECFIRELNQLRPSVYRKGSDELTYNIHIAIRMELECALVEGTITVDELPAIWKEKHREYLGLVPTNDNEGILQNYHWASGNLGYFPTYSLGNLYAAQFAAALRRAFPDMDERLERGELLFIRDWLCEHIFRWGKVWTARELCERVIGEPLNPDYYITYAVRKFTQMYRQS